MPRKNLKRKVSREPKDEPTRAGRYPPTASNRCREGKQRRVVQQVKAVVLQIEEPEVVPPEEPGVMQSEEHEVVQQEKAVAVQLEEPKVVEPEEASCGQNHSIGVNKIFSASF